MNVMIERRLTTGMPHSRFARGPSGKHLTVLPAARGTLYEMTRSHFRQWQRADTRILRPACEKQVDRAPFR